MASQRFFLESCLFLTPFKKAGTPFKKARMPFKNAQMPSQNILKVFT
jgi:hypothetical protein